MDSRTLLLSCILFAAACSDDPGDSSDNEGGGGSGVTGGSAGSAGSGGSGATSTSGGSSASGSQNGGTSGTSTSGAGGSSAGSSGGDACGDLTRNGRCAGNVYEWCDYFTGGVARLDCTPLGATCRAEERQIYEEESNGCILETCGTNEPACDGRLERQCELGNLVINDCTKFGGPGSRCDADGFERCTPQECSTPNVFSCAGDLLLICREDGTLDAEDCSRCDPAGTCVPGLGEFGADCDRFSWGCEE